MYRERATDYATFENLLGDTQKQLRNRFKASQKQIENMLRKQQLLRHSLLKNEQEVYDKKN